jgi:hypothetical protein
MSPGKHARRAVEAHKNSSTARLPSATDRIIL